MIPTLSSFSLNDIVKERKPGQVLWYQLYVNGNRSITEKMVKNAEKLGCNAIVVTVDAPGLGKREKDMRQKFNTTLPDAIIKKPIDNSSRNQGASKALSSFIDPSLCWDDLAWIKSITSMTLILKGIQTGEDALLAVKHGVRAIIVSNHGGRQLDFARSSVEALEEITDALRSNNLEDNIDIFVDGGIRRGTDVFKCLALGAKAVGIGRPVLYGMAGYGQLGVERVLEILREELETTMRLMGTVSINDIRRDMIVTKNLHTHTSVIYDTLSTAVYQKMTLVGKL